MIDLAQKLYEANDRAWRRTWCSPDALEITYSELSPATREIWEHVAKVAREEVRRELATEDPLP